MNDNALFISYRPCLSQVYEYAVLIAVGYGPTAMQFHKFSLSLTASKLAQMLSYVIISARTSPRIALRSVTNQTRVIPSSFSASPQL
jgi:hypothetical protein